MGNANADNLIGRILTEAEAAAKQIAADADESCAEIVQDRDRRVAEFYAAAEKTRNTQAREILDGAQTRARLEGRKELLAAKRELLDEAFETVYRTVSEWPEHKLRALYCHVLDSEAEPGDTVAAASTDLSIVKAASLACKAQVTVSDTIAPVTRGFVLYGKSYEKDCSLKAILSELRDREESKVAEILFS